jgi:GGDEF domain-containing protein
VGATSEGRPDVRLDHPSRGLATVGRDHVTAPPHRRDEVKVPEHPGSELTLLEATVVAQRSLLRARRPEEVVRALERTVLDLGGEVVPGHVGGDEVLHLDLALGVRDAVLPWAPPGSPARDRIQRVLPPLLEDARRLIHLLWAREDREDPTLRDELTGGLHRNATVRLLERAAEHAQLVALEVADADAVDRTHGASRVEVLVRQLARFVRSELDVDERLGRLDGPVVAVLLPHPSDERAEELVQRVRQRWERQRVVPVGLRTAAVRRGSDPDAALGVLHGDLRDLPTEPFDVPAVRARSESEPT